MQYLADIIQALPPEPRALAQAFAIPGAAFLAAAFATLTARFI